MRVELKQEDDILCVLFWDIWTESAANNAEKLDDHFS